MSTAGEQRVKEELALVRGLTTVRTIVSLLLAGVLVTGVMLKGCGYKGPLYLPDTAKQPTADDQAKKKSKQQN